MINAAPLGLFRPFGKSLVRPLYADYSFGNIPNTVHYLLTGEQLGPLLPPDCFGGMYPRPQKIVLFFIDALGWQTWQEHMHRFVTPRRIADEGTLTPISALFPSTTAASVATMNFGVLPAEHAFYEWYMYVPAYGEVIQSLPFCPLGPRHADACRAKGYDPRDLFAVRETVHQRLARHGVRSLQFAHASYGQSAPNSILSAGAEVFTHHSLPEAMTQLKGALAAVKGKAWLSLYWGGIDSIGHHYGPGSRHHAAEIASFWATFDTLLRGIKSPDTLYLFTADHGQIYVPMAETFYINERIPALADCLPVSPAGRTIYPSGSPRDLFLHVKPERKDEALATLSNELRDVAQVMTVDDAIGQQLFGPGVLSAELRRRLGDILILPHDGRIVFWHERKVMANKCTGHHGGLAPAELITVLGAIDQL